MFGAKEDLRRQHKSKVQHGMKWKTLTLKSTSCDRILAVPCLSSLVFSSLLPLNLSIHILKIIELSYVPYDKS